jgi:hypothetical protein
VRQLAAIYRDRRGEDELRAVPCEAARFQKIACGIEVHLHAELEVLLGAAGDERGEMEHHADLGRDERARKRRIGQVAEHLRRRALIGRHELRPLHRARQRRTDVAGRAGDEYSHGRGYSK